MPTFAYALVKVHIAGRNRPWIFHLHCQAGDLIILCSLPHYSTDAVEVAEIARTRGATVLCITDRPTSPLIKYADVTFYADAVRRLLPNSITSAVAIAEGIIAAVANRRREGMDVHQVLDARKKRNAEVIDRTEG
ncbi:MAG: SIS domain-containing protein [Paracoccaceae bacterium]|nr:SIS domain-containing protein [Paracoccaceae bacterium]|tara:strand:+ start:99 stop:503 length:405 start_codon:yes stop_codon:yes gene_type:complete